MCQISPYTLPCCRRVYVSVTKLPSCPNTWPKKKCPPELCIQNGYDPEERHSGSCWRCQATRDGHPLQSSAREHRRPGIDRAGLARGLDEVGVEGRKKRAEEKGECFYCRSRGPCGWCGAQRERRAEEEEDDEDDEDDDDDNYDDDNEKGGKKRAREVAGGGGGGGRAKKKGKFQHASGNPNVNVAVQSADFPLNHMTPAPNQAPLYPGLPPSYNHAYPYHLSASNTNNTTNNNNPQFTTPQYQMPALNPVAAAEWASEPVSPGTNTMWAWGPAAAAAAAPGYGYPASPDAAGGMLLPGFPGDMAQEVKGERGGGGGQGQAVEEEETSGALDDETFLRFLQAYNREYGAAATGGEA